MNAIAGTPGVDVLWVGHFDLTQSMGIPAEFHNPRFLDALKQVIAAADLKFWRGERAQAGKMREKGWPRALKFKDFGKVAATFCDVRDNRAVRVVALETAKEAR